ncbi:MAG: FAD-binding oxidoreductase [Myxococcaceae bacterium]|nr:FAD-binding oxidoreductase [Myxococcaceae bacterium]
MSIAPLAVSALPPPRQSVLEARGALEAVVRGRLSTRELDRLATGRDLWPLTLLWLRQGKVPPPPDAVVWPGTDDEVASVVRIARERRLALIPFGAGSGVCGGTLAVHGGVMVDLKRFDTIGPVDPVRRCVDVGAGVMGETLERRLAARGWTLGHFPSSIGMSTVGGWLAARSAGQLSSRYGKIEDMVLSVRGVLGTGERFETPERPFDGPDVAQVLLGSEGTLCVFTGARLRVHPRPEARVFRAFEVPSVERGLEAIRRVFREGLRPAVVRLYDPFDTTFVGRAKPASPRKAPSKRSALEATVLPGVLKRLAIETLGRPGLVNPLTRLATRSRLIFMCEGEAKHAAAEDRAIAAACLSMGGVDLGEGPGREWYRKRYDVNARLPRLMEAGTFIDTMEVSAPWDAVFEVYERVREVAGAYALVLCHFSHAYADGCSLYFSFVGSGRTEAEIEDRYQQLWRAALGAATSAGANVSHHHGIGLLKARAYQDSLGEGRHALATLKRLFDPDGILNPGKLGL